MNRRQVLGGAAAVGVAWVTPTVMIAKPSEGATLSFPAGAHTVQAVDAPPAQTPLAFTGDDLERDGLIGAGLLAAGWAIQHWAARGKSFPL